MNETRLDRADRLLIEVHHKLELACAAGSTVPPGTSAMLSQMIHDMRLAAFSEVSVRRAESIAVDLRRVDLSRSCRDGQHLRLLACARDAARMMVADARRREVA